MKRERKIRNFQMAVLADLELQRLYAERGVSKIVKSQIESNSQQLFILIIPGLNVIGATYIYTATRLNFGRS